MRKHLWSLAALLLLLTPLQTRAQLIFNLSPNIQTGAPGGTVTFTGELTNADPVFELSLDSISFNLFGPATLFLTPDPTAFFAVVPPVLMPLETYTGPLFSVDIAGNTPPGLPNGSATISGTQQTGGPGTPVEATQFFQVAVVPEPGTLSLVLPGALSGGGFMLRGRRRRA